MTNNSSGTSSKSNVPEAREALNKFKYEVASEIGVPLKQGYNGDLTSAQNGYVGGYMVKKMIEEQERMMAGKSSTPSSTSSR
ncbi:MAG: alpha/beta-type small acid-soluble spore protein [Lachnospiraceae bacterium]|nr:alpha/beta-type small acid-soluble spore protein [Lachnospiraceae bacterium]